MSWGKILGQQKVIAVLRHALKSGRVPHAYLFVGPEGVGKDAVALELARTIHCERGGDEACDECDSCRRMSALQHPDVRLVVPLPRGKDETDEDGPLDRLGNEVATVREQYRLKGTNPYHQIIIPKALNIKVNSIREIRRESSLSTSDGKRKVFVLSGVENMNEASGNMMLKTLEEPTGDTMFILTSSLPEQVLGTIRSRCQVLRFDPLSEHDIASSLQSWEGIDEPLAATVARMAAGSYARARGMLSADVRQMRLDVVEFVRHTLIPGPSKLVEDAERIAELKDRDVARNFLLLTLMWFRDAMALANGGDIVNEDQRADLARFVKNFPAADLPRLMNGLEVAIAWLDRNVQVRLLMINVGLLCKATIQGESSVGSPGPLYGNRV